MKDNGHTYFIKYLESAETEPGCSPKHQAQAAFVLSVICDGYEKGQQLCAQV